MPVGLVRFAGPPHPFTPYKPTFERVGCRLSEKEAQVKKQEEAKREEAKEAVRSERRRKRYSGPPTNDMPFCDVAGDLCMFPRVSV